MKTPHNHRIVPTIQPNSRSAIVTSIRDAIAGRRRFLVTSHVKPDGDSIGSQMALAIALRAIGKEVRIVNCDAAPAPLAALPGVETIEVADCVEGSFDAVIVLECGDLTRTGIAGLDRFFLINIDHHPGNAMFGAINWFDPQAAACGEMVFDVVTALGVPFDAGMATHLYVAILTDTGSFHHSNISARTFDICRQLIDAGVNPIFVARTVYDGNTIGRLRLFGAVLSSLDVDGSGRLATIQLDREMVRASGGSDDDTEGLINQPLTVREIQAVVFFKESEAGLYRVSFRSKGAIDVGAVASRFGGGGHKNAAGCTMTGSLDDIQARVLPLVRQAIEAADSGRHPGR